MSNRKWLPSDGESSDGAGIDGRALRILLVEDHRDTAAVFAQLLRLSRHTVTVAHTLAEARRRCEAGNLDLIIADLQLPDGWMWDLSPLPEACRGVPVIALSAHGMPEDIERTRQAGYLRHILKPVAVDELLATIQEVRAAPSPEWEDPDDLRAPALAG